MKASHRQYSISLYCCAILLCAMSSLPATAARHALLIGIQNYLDTPHFRGRGIQQLAGPHNDIVILKELLLSERFQFPQKNINTLLDEQATHTGIEKAFQDLAARVQPGDFVYVHFSGHGSEHDNFDDEEISGMDQTWVTYGSPDTGSKDSRDIIDDQINIWLSKIGTTTDNIVFVSDSCHSGSVSRGLLPGVRAIGKDNRPYPGITRSDNLKPVGIRIGASGDTENAYEYRVGGKVYGRFTWHWAQSLSMIKPGETWSDVFHRTEALMREDTITGLGVNKQQPQIASLHSQHHNTLVLAGEIPENLNRIIVTAVDEDGQLRLNAGHINNITKGSVYAIESAADKSTAVKITDVDTYTSKASIISGGTVEVGDILIEQHRAYSFDPIPIVIEGDGLVGQDQIDSFSAGIEEKLDKNEYRMVSERQNDGFIIRLFRPEQRNGMYVRETGNSTLPKSHPDAELQAWVMTMQEDVLDEALHVNLAGGFEQGIDQLAINMGILVDLLDLKKLQSSPPDIQIRAHEIIKDETCDESHQTDDCFRLKNRYRITRTLDLNQLNGQQLPQGSILGFSVANNADEPYYIYLMSLSLRDGGFVQFPYGGRTAEYALIKAGESRKLTDGGALEFASPGLEIIKAIISLKPLDTRAFEFKGVASYRSTVKVTTPQNHLEQLLNRTARRAVRRYAPEPSEWGTIQAEIMVTEREEIQ